MATTPLQRAVKKAQKLLKQVALNEAEPTKLYAALDALGAAYNRDHSEEREELYAQGSLVRAGIPQALEAASKVRAHGRQVALARLDLQEASERGGTSYVPGVGYVQGRRVVG